MKTILFGLATATMTATAAAEGTNGTQPPMTGAYAMVGGTIGGQRAKQIGLQLEAGFPLTRLRHAHLFLRAKFTAGTNYALYYTSTDLGDYGRYQQALIGLETRRCGLRGAICLVHVFDVGYQHDYVNYQPQYMTTSSAVDDSHDILVVHRIGIELGRTIKTRLAGGLPCAFYRDWDGWDGDIGVEASLSIGLAY